MRFFLKYFCVAILMSGCTSYAYQAETAAFFESVSAARQTVESAAKALHEDKQAKRDQERMAEFWTFKITPQCAQLEKLILTGEPDQTNTQTIEKENRFSELLAGCMLKGSASEGALPQELQRIEKETKFAHLLEAVGTIERYAAALAELASSEDEGKFRGATLVAAGRAREVGGLTESSQKEQVSGISALVSEIALASINQRKLLVLRRVIGDAHKEIELIAPRLKEYEETLLRALLVSRSADLNHAVNTSLRQAKKGKKAKRIWTAQEQAIAAMNAYKTAVRLHGGRPAYFGRIVTLHADLRRAVNDSMNTEQLDALLRRMVAVRNDYQELRITFSGGVESASGN